MEKLTIATRPMFNCRRCCATISRIAAGRTPRGHPEGLREAFANLYAEVAQERMARELGEAVPVFAYPRIEDGAHTMAFIEACVASTARGAWVAVANDASA